MMKTFTGIPTDYSMKKHWLLCPENPDKKVDLIFLYPSSCFDITEGEICSVDNKIMKKFAKGMLSHQAAAFEEVANIYVPLWRQVNAAKLPKMSFEEVDRAEWAEPRTDVYAALDYYFERLNQGRPYFLAGHSQGSRLSYMVLSEYMKEHPDYYKNMIAAYCLGDSLTKQYLEDNPHIKAAQASDDLGVVVSWNTEGKDSIGHDSLVVAPGAVSINPLNWRTDDIPASAELNLGSFKPNLLTPGMRKLSVNADAAVNLERGTVIVSEPKLKRCAVTEMPGFKSFESVFGPASYHLCDYSFFFLNIQENARTRAEAWLDKTKTQSEI